MRKSELKLKQEQKKKDWTEKNTDKENSEAAFASYVPDSHTKHTLKTFLPPAPDWPGVSEWQHSPSLKRVRRSDIQLTVQFKPIYTKSGLNHQIWPMCLGGWGGGFAGRERVAMAVSYSFIWAGGSIRQWEGKPWGH